MTLLWRHYRHGTPQVKSKKVVDVPQELPAPIPVVVIEAQAVPEDNKKKELLNLLESITTKEEPKPIEEVAPKRRKFRI